MLLRMKLCTKRAQLIFVNQLSRGCPPAPAPPAAAR
jgi:hypothetical protein